MPYIINSPFSLTGMRQEKQGKRRREGKDANLEAWAGVIKAQVACLTVGKPEFKAQPWSKIGHSTSKGKQSWPEPISPVITIRRVRERLWALMSVSQAHECKDL